MTAHGCSWEEKDGNEIVTVWVEKRPWTVNSERKGNRWKRAELTAEWRQLFKLITKAPHAMTAATAEVFLEQRAPLQDTAACVPAVKAAIDGIVDARVLLDDTGDHLCRIVFHAPVKAAKDRITIRLEGHGIGQAKPVSVEGQCDGDQRSGSPPPPRFTLVPAVQSQNEHQLFGKKIRSDSSDNPRS